MGVGVFTSSFVADKDQVALNQLSKWARENWNVAPEGLKREFERAKNEYNNLSFLDKEDEDAPNKIDFLIDEMNRNPDFANQVAASLPQPDFKVGERVSNSQYHGSGLARLASKAVIGTLTSAATAGIGGALLGDSLANYGLQKILVDNELTNTLSGQLPDKPVNTSDIPEAKKEPDNVFDQIVRTTVNNTARAGRTTREKHRALLEKQAEEQRQAQLKKEAEAQRRIEEEAQRRAEDARKAEQSKKQDVPIDAVLTTIDKILTDAGNPGEGPKILQEQPVSVFNRPQAPPTIEEIAQARELEKPQDPTPDQTAVEDIPLIVPPSGGVLSQPTQPPTDPETGEGQTETKNPLLGVLALLGAGGLLGKTITKNEVDREYKPNIPRVNSQGQRVYSDFDITINEPRLSLEKFRGKRLALPEFMI